MQKVKRLKNRTVRDQPEKPGALRAIRPDEVYSAAELRAIIEAARPGLEKAFLMTAIFTGARHGELCALQRSVVDLKRGTIEINRSLTQLKGRRLLEEPKTPNAFRTLDIPPELAAEFRRWMLQAAPNPQEYIFVDALGNPASRKQNNDMLKGACERAGVKPLSLNNLRHSFASQHLIAGTPPLQVSHMMGHSDPGVTSRSTPNGPSRKSPVRNPDSPAGSSRRTKPQNPGRRKQRANRDFLINS
jgi:integrase